MSETYISSINDLSTITEPLSESEKYPEDMNDEQRVESNIRGDTQAESRLDGEQVDDTVIAVIPSHMMEKISYLRIVLVLVIIILVFLLIAIYLPSIFIIKKPNPLFPNLW
jgi:hypothetical protein